MKYASIFLKSFLILFVSLVYVNSTFAADAFNFDLVSASSKDSLIIKNMYSDKYVVIKPGQKVRIWVSENYPVKGIIKSIHNDSLCFSADKIDYHLHKHQIVKIQLIKGKKQTTWGWILIILGIGYFCFGIFGMIAAIAMGGFEFGGFILLLFLLSPSFILYFLGKNMRSPKYNLLKKWKFL